MKKIAILYPGDMGGNVAQALIEEKFEVFSDLKGRSQETTQNASKIGLENLSLEEISQSVDFIISLVPPKAVIDVAKAYIAAAKKNNTEKAAQFIDMNAKSTTTAIELNEMFEHADMPFINACIIGRAAFIKQEGVIYYSGKKLPAFEKSVGSVFQVIYLGEDIAAATAFKMCFAGFNKTITAVFFEIAMAANHFGITDKLFEELNNKMSGTIQDISKVIGNYPKHINRRQQEMVELSEMLTSNELLSTMAAGSASVFKNVEKNEHFLSLDKTKEAALMTILKAIKP